MHDPRRRLQYRLAVIAALAMLAAATACSGTDASTAVDADRPGAADMITTTTFDAAAWPDMERPPSYGPIDPLASLDRIDEIVGNETANLLERRDDLAYRCLEEAGFVFETGTSQPFVPEGVRSITNSEFVERFAFGVTGAIEAGGDVGISQVNNRQPRYADTLDDHGVPRVPSVTPVDGGGQAYVELAAALNTDTDERDSCATQANDELELASSGPFFAANELRRLVRDTFENHPEVAILQDRYEACMAAAGFTGLPSPSATFAGVKAGLDELMGMMEARTSTPEEARDPDNADGATRDRFGELERREMALARANLGCEGAYTPAALQLVDVVQQQVLADNQPLVATIQAGQ